MKPHLSIPRRREPIPCPDLILWIANLAVNGALNYRWGKDYWTWKGKDSGMVTRPLPISSHHPVKIEETHRLVKLVSSSSAR